MGGVRSEVLNLIFLLEYFLDDDDTAMGAPLRGAAELRLTPFGQTVMLTIVTLEGVVRIRQGNGFLFRTQPSPGPSDVPNVGAQFIAFGCLANSAAAL